MSDYEFPRRQRTHPHTKTRRIATAAAELRLLEELNELTEEHDLTIAETVTVLAGLIATVSGGVLIAERKEAERATEAAILDFGYRDPDEITCDHCGATTTDGHG